MQTGSKWNSCMNYYNFLTGVVQIWIIGFSCHGQWLGLVYINSIYRVKRGTEEIFELKKNTQGKTRNIPLIQHIFT